MTKLLAVVICVLALCAPAFAQNYPTRPIKFIVPFAAGGPADTLARLLADRMKATLAQNLVVENVPGAAGSLGVGRLVRAAPDGYTIGIGHLGTNVFNGALQNLPYDLVKDLEPIIRLPENVSVIVTKKEVPAKNLTELVAWLKAHPDQATAATAGVGSIAHVATVYFERRTGVDLRIVPYRGGGPAVQAVVGGQVTFIFDQFTGASVEMYRTGVLKPFAVAAKERLHAEPNLATVDEAGLPGLYVSTWYGLWAPKGTPKAVVNKLNAAAMAALADPELRKRLEAQSSIIPSRDQQTPEALGAFQKAEIAKWWPVIKAAGIKMQ